MALTTIISRALQGVIVGKITWSNGHRVDHIGLNILGAVVSMPVMIGVYYIGQAIMFNNWITPMQSIPGDVIQNVVDLLIAIPVCIVLKKTPYFKKNF